jgi:hypothetical protein
MQRICEELGTEVCYSTPPGLIVIGLFAITLRRQRKFDPPSRLMIIGVFRLLKYDLTAPP